MATERIIIWCVSTLFTLLGWFIIHSLIYNGCTDAIKDYFKLSNYEKEQILMIIEDYEDDSFGLEAGSLARQIKDIIVGVEQ